MHPSSDGSQMSLQGSCLPRGDCYWEGVYLGSVTSVHDLSYGNKGRDHRENPAFPIGQNHMAPLTTRGLEMQVRTWVTVDTKCLFHSPRRPLLREQSCKIKIARTVEQYREDLFWRAADLHWNLYEWETKFYRMNPLRFRDLTILAAWSILSWLIQGH